MEYRAHFFRHINDSLRPVFSASVPGQTIDEARAAALTLLPDVHAAIGFRLCDRTDRQVDIYVPPEKLVPDNRGVTGEGDERQSD
jgi:hypothetical protein